MPRIHIQYTDGIELLKSFDPGGDLVDAQIPVGYVGQTGNLSLTYQTPRYMDPAHGMVTLRIVMRVDSIRVQAFARIEMWSEGKWTTVHSLFGEQMESINKACNRNGVDFKAYMEDCERLDSAARKILDIVNLNSP